MAEQVTKLVFELFGRDNASPQFDRFGRKVQQTETHVHGLAGAVGKLGVAFAGLEVVNKASEFLKKSVEEGRQNELLMKRTANVIATTGGVAKVTVKDVDELAASIQRKSTVDHEQVLSAENMLLTFKNIRNELGAGNQIFDRTAQAVTDLAATPFANMTSASKMLGKALNDPTKGITALNRAGVTFSAKQKEQIAHFVKQNDLLSAQKIILKEVESQVGGAAASQATAGKRAELAWKDLEEEIGHKLIPTIDKIELKFAKLVESGDLQKWAKEVGTDLQPVGVILVEAGKATITMLKIFEGLPQGAKQAVLLAAGVKLLAGQLPALGAGGIAAEAGLLKTRVGLAGLALQANAARIGAGAAGMALLTYADQISTAGSSTNDLLKVTGAAATGFAVAGPWGAAIGGAGQAVYLFAKRNHTASRDVSGLTSSLDTQTGALTKNTKAMVINALGKKGAGGKSAFQMGTDLGFKPSEITNAALGDAKMMKEIATSIRVVLDNEGAFSPAGKEALALGAALKITTGDLKDAKAAWRDQNEAQRNSIELNRLSKAQIDAVGKAAKGIPKSAITKFTQPGYAKAEQNATDIARKYHLTPKQVATALKALDYTKPQIAAVIKAMKSVDGMVAHPKIKVSSNAKSVADYTQHIVNGVHGKTVYIKFKSTGRVASTSADGDIFVGGVRRFADGGENHVAQIGDGTTRIWDEPETEGEAYIPFAPSKRKRSIDIWEQTGKRLGIPGYANGSAGSSKAVRSSTPVIELGPKSLNQLADLLADSLRGMSIDGRGNVQTKIRRG